MSPRARRCRVVGSAASAVLLAAFSAPTGPRATRPAVSTEGPAGDTPASAIPALVVHTSGVAVSDRPLNLTRQRSTSPGSSSTFAVPQPSVPRLTLLYQNFPNPFPTAAASETCFWFDLHRTSRVHLTIHGIRGDLVRTLVPSAQLTGELAAGRYGRGAPGSGLACDPQFAWDGRGDDGRMVPPGVYLVRLRTDAHESFKKILFRGR